MHIRVGVNWGRMLAKEDDVFGDAVNVAARIQASADVDEVVISESLYEQVKHLRDLPISKKVEAVRLKGKQGSFDLYSLRWK